MTFILTNLYSNLFNHPRHELNMIRHSSTRKSQSLGTDGYLRRYLYMSADSLTRSLAPSLLHSVYVVLVLFIKDSKVLSFESPARLPKSNTSYAFQKLVFSVTVVLDYNCTVAILPSPPVRLACTAEPYPTIPFLAFVFSFCPKLRNYNFHPHLLFFHAHVRAGSLLFLYFDIWLSTWSLILTFFMWLTIILVICLFRKRTCVHTSFLQWIFR